MRNILLFLALILTFANPVEARVNSTGGPTNLVTRSGSLTSGNCVQATTNNQLVTISGPCGTGSGTITATGSPATGNLTKFSGSGSITNGDLSGDVTTSSTLAATVAKIQGVAVNGTTGTGNVVFSAASTLTGTTTFSTGSPTTALIQNVGDSSHDMLCLNGATTLGTCAGVASGSDNITYLLGNTNGYSFHYASGEWAKLDSGGFNLETGVYKASGSQISCSNLAGGCPPPSFIAGSGTATASGTDALAWGNSATATGTNSIVIGENATDNGHDNSIIIGQGASATASRFFVIGNPSYGQLIIDTSGNFLLPFNAAGNLITTQVTLANGAAAAVGTITNAPSAGNPTKWIPINDNGTTRYIPTWTR